MKREIVYLMVRVEVDTSFKNISETVHELETRAVFSMTDTQNITVINTELLVTRVRNPKK